ncbi:MAG TPA: hypothetical protein VGR53_10060 [Nitrososphaerales archaeon]|nr:hypothetical protein [Nitrososphaerales archaeon]
MKLHRRIAVAKRTVIALVSVIALVAIIVAALAFTGASGGTGANTQPGQRSSTTQSQTTSPQSTYTGPLTNVQLSGIITTSGLGTKPTRIAFTGAPGTFNATISGGHYQLTLPGPATYGVYVQWTGAFPWQAGTVNTQLFKVEINSTTHDVGVPTPNSVVQVSGRVNLTGNETHATMATFSYVYGQPLTAPVSSGAFSVTLPNFANYTVQVNWSGAYAWQKGTVAANSIVVSAQAGVANTTANLRASTPDSVITMTGSATSSGTGTTVTGVTYSTKGLSFPAALSGSQYKVRVPNLASFNTSVTWAGAYAWQGGTTSTAAASVFLPPGLTLMSQDLSAHTPNSVVSVSGGISLATGLTPTLITFTANGMQFTATPSAGTYTVQLPNLTNYVVSINWAGSGQTGTCHPTPDTYPLSLGAGVASASGINWAC